MRESSHTLIIMGKIIGKNPGIYLSVLRTPRAKHGFVNGLEV